MFYTGDLHSGISKAVKESKVVACFVTDGGEESQLWENEFLLDDTLNNLLTDQSVLLRLQAGSQEAGYLAAIFPVPKNPTVVIIKNGELKEYLASGTSKEDFLRRVHSALRSHVPQPESASAGVTTPQAVPQMTAGQPTPAPTPAANPSAVQNLLAERSVRLEAQKKEQDAKEKAKRSAEAKAKKEAAEKAAAPGSKSSADMNYALMQKKRQQDARDERARILKRVEDDKAERREREAERKARLQDIQVTEAGPSTMRQAASTNSKDCNIQIRLFDGSTIRSKFPSSGSLAKDVRPWIDEKQEGDSPYTFKQVLTPLPNKNIQASEEEQSLQSLGLTPSATLILLPVTDYTSAYEGGTGYVSKGVSAGYNIVSSGIGMVSSVFSGFLGGAPTPAPEPERTNPTPSATAGPRINVRTLRDQDDRRDDQQFYNGNALNFEPRKDDDKKDD